MIPTDDKGATNMKPYISRRVPEAPASAHNHLEIDGEYIDSSQSPSNGGYVRTGSECAANHQPMTRRMRYSIGVRPGEARIMAYGPNGHHGYITYATKLEEVTEALSELAIKRDEVFPQYISSSEAHSDAVEKAETSLAFSDVLLCGRRASELEDASHASWMALMDCDMPAKNLMRTMVKYAEPDADPEEVKRELVALYLGDYASHPWYERFQQGW